MNIENVVVAGYNGVMTTIPEIEARSERMSSQATFQTSARSLRFLRKAAELALTSCVDNAHGAVVVSHGKVVSVGINSMRNDPAFIGDDIPVIGRSSAITYPLSVHAEVAAMMAASPEALRSSTVYVARVNTPRIFGHDLVFASDSRPCSRCWGLLLSAGVSTVVYSVGDARAITRSAEIEFG